jgi:bifunctional DNA-binding transcriptional regulator/antitoxin component of YhaV-PrlF toxin-antitoxin module
MEIPPEVRIRAGIKTGTVYYFKEETHKQDAPPHHFVIINSNPALDRVLVLVCASSQIEKIKKNRKNLPSETLVEVSHSDYTDFVLPTIFDCNTVYEKTISQIVKKLVNKKLGAYNEDMGSEIVARLRNAVLASPLVRRGIKELLK